MPKKENSGKAAFAGAPFNEKIPVPVRERKQPLIKRQLGKKKW